METTSWRRGHGFTLLELLLSVGIIMILMSLLLPTLGGALLRARNLKWQIEAPQRLNRVRDQLNRFYQTRTNYPAWSLDQLAQQKALDDFAVDFLKLRKVQFHPFGSAAAPDFIVVRVDMSQGKTTSYLELTKAEITPKPCDECP